MPTLQYSVILNPILKPTFKLGVLNKFKTSCLLPSAFTQVLNSVSQQDLVLI